MKKTVWIVRIIVGCLFIFSGMVKTIDPIGFGYKLEEYFSPDVLNLPFLMDFALPMSVFFVIFEVMLGVFLLLGIYRRFTMISLLLLIIFFTFLTFYSAFFNKVTDCGCFGDFLKLTPWESFYKDLILLILILFLFVYQKHIEPIFDSLTISNVFGLGMLIVCLVVAYFGLEHLPIIDFRPYAVGKNIVEGMKSAEELGLEPPKYDNLYSLKNKQSGEEVKVLSQEYLDNYWEKDSPWEIIETQEQKISDGYEPPIHDFNIDCNGEDKTEYYLSQPKVLMIIVPIADEANDYGLDQVNQLIKQLENTDIEIVALTSGEVNINAPQCFVDMTTLKTIIRANPGLVFVSNGTVKAKYHWNDVPKAEKVKSIFK